MKGTKQIAQRIVNAHESFEDMLMEIAGISKDQAAKVTALYLKLKVAKLDAVNAEIKVKHGAYLDLPVIMNAVAH